MVESIYYSLVEFLCVIEMKIKYLLNKKYYNSITEKSSCPLYCDDCKYADTSDIAKHLLGYQSSGYCHYLKDGDFKGTFTLFDGCRECSASTEEWEKFEKENNIK
jgi:hypothetical protein